MKPHLNLSLNIVMNTVRVEACHLTSSFHIYILCQLSACYTLKVQLKKMAPLQHHSSLNNQQHSNI